MRILYISPRQCWPPHSGSKLRTYHFAKVLGERASLTHVFFYGADDPRPSRADLPFCERLVAVPPPPRFTPLQLAAGLVGPWPLTMLHYWSREMNTAIATLADQERFDLVHLDCTVMTPYVQILRRQSRAPIFCDWHNIESELMRRYGENANSAARRAYAAITARRLVAVEKRLLKQAAGHIVCSRREQEALSRLGPNARIAVVGNGVNARYYQEPVVCGERRRLLFVGHMAYHANIGAAIPFVRNIWPRIRERFPNWTLTLAGSCPPPSILALGNESNVEVTGTVPDLRPYYGEAVASIVPLSVGGGTRLKILEAMAAGVPVISTRIGCEGLPVSPGADILIADKDEDWFRCLSELSATEDLRERLISRGREIAARYDWEALGESLWKTYCGWLG